MHSSDYRTVENLIDELDSVVGFARQGLERPYVTFDTSAKVNEVAVDEKTFTAMVRLIAGRA
jgi:hypothetical protein